MGLKDSDKFVPLVTMDDKEDELIWVPPTLSEWLVQQEAKERWMIKGFLPYEAKVLCSGQKKRGMKSMFTMQMLLSLYTDKGPMLLRPSDKELIGCPILAIQEESTSAEMRDRILALCNAMGHEWDDFGNFRFSFHDMVKLDDKRWRQKVLSAVRYFQPKVVCLDPFYKLHNSDENKVNEILHVLDLLEQIRQMGATTILVAHLDKVRGEKEGSDIDNQVRGTGILTDDYDLHLALRRYHMKVPFVHLTCRSKGSGDEEYRMFYEAVDATATEEMFDGKMEISMEKYEGRDE